MTDAGARMRSGWQRLGWCALLLTGTVGAFVAVQDEATAQDVVEIGQYGDPLPEWRIDGTNTFRAEQSGVAGDASANPNPDNAFNFFEWSWLAI